MDTQGCRPRRGRYMIYTFHLTKMCHNKALLEVPDWCRSLKLNGSYRAHIDTSLWVGFTLIPSEVWPHQVLMSLALMSNSIISVQLRSLISKTNDLFVILSLSIPQHFYKMPLDIREKKKIRVKSWFYE